MVTVHEFYHKRRGLAYQLELAIPDIGSLESTALVPEGGLVVPRSSQEYPCEHHVDDIQSNLCMADALIDMIRHANNAQCLIVCVDG